MKNTTKIIFGGFALAITFGASLLSEKAFAAEKITNIESNFVIQANKDPNNTRLGVDHLMHEFISEFRVNQRVNDGDYFEIETHSLPVIPSQAIYASATDKTQIGNITCAETRAGARQLAVRYPVNSQEFKDLNPSDGQIRKCRVVFNKNAENANDINFSFILKSASMGGLALADRVFTTRTWVKVNDVEKISKEYTVSPMGRVQRPVNGGFFWRAIFNENNNNISLCPGFSMGEDYTGGAVEIELPQNSYFKFIKNNTENIRSGSNFRFDDTSTVNQHGIIYTPNVNLVWEGKLKNVTDDTISYTITKGAQISAGLGCELLEFSELGEKYIAENSKLPEVFDFFKIRIKNKDGATVYESGNIKGPLAVAGNSSNFISSIKQKQSSEEEKTPELETPQVPQTPQIAEETPELETPKLETPDTGSKKDIFTPIFAISGVVVLIGSAIFFKKKF